MDLLSQEWSHQKDMLSVLLTMSSFSYFNAHRTLRKKFSFSFTHMSPCNETTATRQRLCEAAESYLRSRRELAASLVRETRDNNV